jgi:hypothetical protein
MGDDTASAPVTASTSAIDPKSLLIDLLGIPGHLTGPGDVALSVAYQKYKAFLVACQTLDNKVANQSWPIKRPTQSELIELFVSKSFFHSHYCRLFQKVTDYPEMKAWLEGESESADVDVWGVKKVNYSFSDLKVWLENGGTLALDDEDEEFEKYKVVKRGKGKGRKKTWKRGRGRRRRRRRRRRRDIRRRRAVRGQSK